MFLIPENIFEYSNQDNRFSQAGITDLGDTDVPIDPSQFANQKGLSIQHYLDKMIDKNVKSVDTNWKRESLAVLATLVDWKQAFPRQCPKLGVRSFIKKLSQTSPNTSHNKLLPVQKNESKMEWRNVSS